MLPKDTARFMNEPGRFTSRAPGGKEMKRGNTLLTLVPHALNRTSRKYRCVAGITLFFVYLFIFFKYAKEPRRMFTVSFSHLLAVMWKEDPGFLCTQRRAGCCGEPVFIRL